MTLAELEPRGRGRGPDPRAVNTANLFDHARARILRIRALEAALLREADGYLADKFALLADGISLNAEFGREINTVIRMRDGVEFWHRDPAEPR
jgi:hypothetical protein